LVEKGGQLFGVAETIWSVDLLLALKQDAGLGVFMMLERG
jgi:hypothetical protein